MKLGRKLTACAVGLLLFASSATSALAGTGTPPLAKLTITGRASNVACIGPCCGTVLFIKYQGVDYIGTYRRCFKPLRDGDTVTTTGRPWR